MRELYSAQEKTFQLLRDQIMNLALLPGTRMSAYELSEKLRVSRTPVREAFIRLESESLVEILPQRRTLVSRIDFARVRQERFLREALELKAIPHFLENLGRDGLAGMREIIRLQREAAQKKRSGQNPQAWRCFSWERLFHRGTAAELGGRRKNGRHYRRVRMVRENGDAEKVIREHGALIEAFEARDVHKSLALTEAHLQEIILKESKLKAMRPDFFFDG